MLTSKFDLYNVGWLDLVFENRNKNYGAYYLRQHYADNMVRAMVITFLGLLTLFGLTAILNPDKPNIHTTVVDITPTTAIQPPPAQPIKKIEPPAPAKSVKPQAPEPTVATQRFVPPVVVKDPDATEKITLNKDLTGTIGQVETKGKTGQNTLPVETNGNGAATPVEDTKVYTIGGLEVMPQPKGGESAWAKFLNKNLRYPVPAQEEGVSGKVVLSFIIEKDGQLSNIVVLGPAGHGFDEEALRVLKLAKAWNPGKQNGQPVRVRFAIPINFQLSSE
ncbi:MAG: Gram-negative bacterial tonB protein [Mucilaginibacter sp.]|nr:Gram-negative bacterial tonB protein [Mucilaginibacter sp.]